MKLARALYFSKALADAPTAQVLSEIVGSSNERNTREELTGVLVCHDGWFLQALEGLPSRLSRLLFRLSTDPRHQDMQMIDFRAIDRRAFEGWGMRHGRFTPDLAYRLQSQGLLGHVFDPTTMTEARVMALLVAAADA